jgi:hypothetical protein
LDKSNPALTTGEPLAVVESKLTGLSGDEYVIPVFCVVCYDLRDGESKSYNPKTDLATPFSGLQRFKADWIERPEVSRIS